MKKGYALGLMLMLTTLLFAGCRDMQNSTGSTTVPATSAATQPTVIPSPDITLPLDTTVPDTTEPETTIAEATTRPSARGPRY